MKRLKDPNTWCNVFLVGLILFLSAGLTNADVGSTRPDSSAAVETVQADVEALSTSVAAMSTSVDAVATTTTSTNIEVEEIEKHVHNYGRSFGVKASQTATRFAEGVGILAVATDDIFYTFEPGNQAVWGDWQQIWGTDE